MFRRKGSNCHVFFDWSNMKILEKTNFVHNPHYDEWVQKNGGDSNSTPNFVGICGVTNHTISKLNIDAEYQKMLIETLRVVNQIRDEVNRANTRTDKKLHNYRMDFLENNITKKELKIKVQRVHKASMKLRDTNQIRDMYSETVYQILGHLLNDVKDKNKTDDFLNNTENAKKTREKLKELKEYAEEHLEKVGKRYNSQKPRLSDWEYFNEKEKKREYERKMGRRASLGDLACKNPECGNRKSYHGKSAQEQKCYNCWSTDLRIKRESRRSELIKQGVRLEDINKTLRKEGLTEY